MERPVSVTVTCWVIIALAVEAIIGLLSGLAEASLKEMLNPIASPLSFSATVASGAVISAITIILALLMLRGANWARVVYLAIMTILFLCMLVSHAHLPTAILFVTFAKVAVFGIFLLRPPANRYFVPALSTRQNDVAA